MFKLKLFSKTGFSWFWFFYMISCKRGRAFSLWGSVLYEDNLAYEREWTGIILWMFKWWMVWTIRHSAWEHLSASSVKRHMVVLFKYIDKLILVFYLKMETKRLFELTVNKLLHFSYLHQYFNTKSKPHPLNKQFCNTNIAVNKSIRKQLFLLTPLLFQFIFKNPLCSSTKSSAP